MRVAFPTLGFPSLHNPSTAGMVAADATAIWIGVKLAIDYRNRPCASEPKPAS